MLTGSDERDAVRLRTSVQTGNRVVLCRVAGRPEMMRELFVEYLDLANELAERPRFYRTILDNCTTVIWKLADRLLPGLPIDYRVVLSCGKWHFRTRWTSVGATEAPTRAANASAASASTVA
jgi:hypothetical protein